MFLLMGLSYDLFTHTDTENHHKVSQDIFLKLKRTNTCIQKSRSKCTRRPRASFCPIGTLKGPAPTAASNERVVTSAIIAIRCLRALQSSSILVASWMIRPLKCATPSISLSMPRWPRRARRVDSAEDKAHWRPQVLTSPKTGF